MKRKPCILCSNYSFKREVNSPYLEIISCNNCGLFSVPQSKKKRRIGEYFKNYDLEKYTSYYESFRKEIYKKNWQEVKVWKKTGKSLDFGSSLGWFLEVAPKGWQAYGLEPSIVAEKSKEKGLRVIRGSDEKIDNFNFLFDLITMWNVIEHLPDPINVLKKLRKKIKKDGIIAIAFPNRRGFYNLLSYLLYRITFGWFVKPLYVLFQVDNPVPHLYHYRIEDIKKMLEKIGFSVIKISPQRIVDAKNLWKREELDKDITTKLMGFFGIPIIILFDYILEKLNKNQDEIVIYARKVENI